MAEKINTYGLEAIKSKEWMEKILKGPSPQVNLDLYGFGRAKGTEDLGGLSRMDHCKIIISKYYPWVWKTWNDWAEMCLWAWCNYDEVGATGCTTSGKSYIFSFLAWLEYSCSSMSTACIISSTTKSAIRARIWPHIKKFRMNFVVNGQATQFPCHLIDSMTLIQCMKGDDMHAMTSLAVEGGRLESAWGNLIGRHPDRMICFVDEGEQTPEAIFKSRYNLQSGTILYKFITASNAVNPASAYGQFIEPKSGWSSAKDTDDFWETKTGICIHFDGLKSPNVIAGKVVVPGLIGQDTIDRVRIGEGEDSLVWWSQIRGFPPMSGVRNTVLSWAHIINSKAKDGVIWQGSKRWIAALDPAFTSGGDDCVLRMACIGKRDDGMNTLGLEPPIKIKLVKNDNYPEDYQIADQVREHCDAKQIPPADFAMDATACSGLASIIEQRWKPGIRKINFGSSPTDRKMPGDDKTAKERCKNRVGELWFAFAAIVRAGQVRMLDPESAQQFCTRQFTLQGEKYVLESKLDMKSRTGGKSPDVADATALLGDIFRDIAGIDGGTVVKANDESWERMAQKHHLEEEYV